MPWKYVMPHDAESLQKREAALQRIGAFWEEFVRRLPEVEARLAGQSDWDLAGWMNEQLTAVHPRLRHEFGQDLGGRYLVVTCEMAHHLRPMVDSFIRRAPEIPNWTFREFRPAHEPEDIPNLVRARTGHVMGSTTVQARIGHERRVDFTFQSLLAGQDEEAALANARAALDYLVGEDVAARWGGHLDVVEISPALTHSFVPLPRVRSQVLDIISTVLGGLPDRPYWKMPQLAPVEVKLRPEKREEYGGQDDAMFAQTVIPELREAGLKPGFCSCRFSRQGEVFCYLKIDASDVDLDTRYRQKKTVEQAMDAELRENGVGCVVGTATGRKYIYIDLAVTDIVKTLDATRRRLLALEMLPPRSWLLFYDAELAGEYIGLRSSSPKPPLWTEPKEQEPVKASKAMASAVRAAIRETKPDPSPELGGLDNPNWMMDPLR